MTTKMMIMTILVMTILVLVMMNQLIMIKKYKLIVMVMLAETEMKAKKK
jgi:hypothetical protein